MGADVPCENGLGVNAEFLGQIKGAFQACKLRDVAKHLGLIHVHGAVATLDEPDDVLVQQPLFVFVRHFADARLTADEFLKRILGKHTVHAGQAQGDARDDVRIDISPRGRLKGRNRLDGCRLERSRRSHRGHGRPGRRWGGHPAVQIARCDGTGCIVFGVSRGLRGDGGDDALHLLGGEAEPVGQRDVPVAEGSRIAAVGGNAVAHIGTNGPVACIIRIQRTGLDNGGSSHCMGRDGRCGRTAAWKGSGTDTQ